jgi:hypothetical protein
MASKEGALEVQLGVEEWRDGELVGCWKQSSSLPDEVRATKTKRSQRSRGWWWQSVLLPEGYPESVSEDYAVYQAWDTVQALCSSITGFLCTRALLQGAAIFLLWPGLTLRCVVVLFKLTGWLWCTSLQGWEWAM